MVQSRLLTAGAAVLTLAGTALAQPTGVRSTTTTTTTTTEVRKASGFLHANVALEGGATVGRITDFVLSDGGCIEYVVVDSNGQYVLLPYQAVRYEPGQNVVQVNVTAQKWHDLPTFTGSNWPVHDQAYISKVRTAFGVTGTGVRDSSYRGGDRGVGDRQPLDRRDNRQDNRDNRRDQRSGVENPNRTGNVPPTGTNPPTTRPGDNRNPPPPDVNRGTGTSPGRTPPPPPPGTPGTNPNDRPPA